MHPIVFKDHTGPGGDWTSAANFAWTSGTAGSSYCLEHPVLLAPVLRGAFGVEGDELSVPSPLDTPRLVTGGIGIFRPPISPDLEFGPPV